MPVDAGSPTRRRGPRVVAVVVAAVAAMGCVGGSPFGANPADGGCGFRPDGLVAADLVGSWRGGTVVVVTLRADGTFDETPPSASPAPSPSPSAGARPVRPSPTPNRVTGRWELLPKTHSGDITLTADPADNRPFVSSFFVTGTRAKPELYTYGDGDPDSCSVIRYERFAPP